MATTAPITQTKDVPTRVEFVKYHDRERRLLGELKFDVANRTFHGGIRFAVDLDT
ncbi:hypothetical protein KY320_01895 [Candidatus Woesearchaeota archaeon]|nr:hypothetical protein [Candidatus Woesearchaeota archaeon]